MSLEIRSRFPAKGVDWLLALATALAFLGAGASSPEEAGRSPGVVTLVFAALIGGALVFRRRWPLGVFVYSIVLITAYQGLDFPAVGMAFPLAASLYTAAAHGRGVPAAVVAGASLVAGVIWRIIVEPEAPLLVAVNMTQEGVGLAAALFLGETVRSRRALTRETSARLALVEAEQRMESERSVIDERMEIARDLHDVVAHTVTMIGIQANLAVDAFDDRSEEARKALGSIKSASREAMLELRSAVDVLRQGETAPLLPAPGLEGLPDLIANAREGGLEVEIRSGGPGDVPAIVGVAVYRVVQEALTNVLRHSGARRVTIELTRSSESIQVKVEDDGTGRTGDAIAGHGIVGMTERVGSLGGWLHTGNGPVGGFRVEARIPLGASG